LTIQKINHDKNSSLFFSFTLLTFKNLANKSCTPKFLLIKFKNFFVRRTLQFPLKIFLNLLNLVLIKIELKFHVGKMQKVEILVGFNKETLIFLRAASEFL
jgi:hypothetical protein